MEIRGLKLLTLHFLWENHLGFAQVMKAIYFYILG